MSKKLTFHCVSGRDLLIVGLPMLSTRVPELDAVLLVLLRKIDRQTHVARIYKKGEEDVKN